MSGADVAAGGLALGLLAWSALSGLAESSKERAKTGETQRILQAVEEYANAGLWSEALSQAFLLVDKNRDESFPYMVRAKVSIEAESVAEAIQELKGSAQPPCPPLHLMQQRPRSAGVRCGVPVYGI